MAVSRVVAVTGCDSGLGWAIAARSAREGFITVAGMYNGTDTKAARALEKLCAHPRSLDVTNPESVAGFRDYVKSLIDDNPNYKLYAIVNNAGVLTVGDYECQTPSMIENTINVNLLGTMRVVSAFLPDLRRSAIDRKLKPRIVNVASHCSLQPLPGFGPYCASKAGLLMWTQVLRLEQKPHGLYTTVFIPGSFFSSSNLLANQDDKGSAMLEHLNEEQKSFYEKKITTLVKYLGAIPVSTDFNSMNDQNIIETFMKTLTDESPKQLYKVESWKYTLYYNLLFKLPFPETVYHWLIKKFLAFPKVK